MSVLEGIGHSFLRDPIQMARGGRIRDELLVGTHEPALDPGQRQCAFRQLQ